MPSSPQHAGSNKFLLKHTRVVLNDKLVSAPMSTPLNENLLNRDVFDYDFGRERVFLEIANNEIEAKKRAEAKHRKSSCADISNGVESLSVTTDGDDDEEKPGRKSRASSADDIAAAISASLREY